jgi:Ca2+-binding EF-hand superfamily protein
MAGFRLAVARTAELENEMGKTLLAALGFAALASACGLAQAQDHQDGPRRGGLFQHFDANHDGVVTHQEFDAARAADFLRLDANHDGQLTREEMREGFRQAWRRHGRGQGGLAMLTRADANHDGAITRDEFLARPERMFERLDQDHDGTISAAELQQIRADGQARREQFHERRQQGESNGDHMDANGDAAISCSEYDARGASMFQRLDTNNDGRITQAEAEAARPHRDGQ